MSSILSGLIILALILLAILTVSQAFLASQDTLATSWREMESRTAERARTHLSLINAQTANGGTLVDLTLKNDGEAKLTDYDRWDLVLQYYDDSGSYVTDWYPYVSGSLPGLHQWAVTAIYVNAAQGTPEVYDPGILDPGEEMVVRVQVLPPIGAGTVNQATLATANGFVASTAFAR